MRRAFWVVVVGALAGCAGTDVVDGGSSSSVTTGTGEHTTVSTSASSGAGTGGAGGSVEPPAPFCGNGHIDADLGEACDDGNANPFDGCRPDCTIVEPIEAPANEWTWIETPGTQCMNGDTAGFGISIVPGSRNLMIYLEGGGACFNDACDFSALNVPYVPPPDGIFNRNNDGNPVHDWSMIYVPYCTGDIHGGDKDTELGGQVRHFHGYSNITKYLERWVVTFQHLDNVLLTGISAGGFGAGLNFPQVADAFASIHKDGGPQMTLVDDSGPPFGNDVIPPCLEDTFRTVWGLDQTVLKACGTDCPNPSDFASGLIDHVITRYPTAHFGVFSNAQDTVIRTFMGFGWGNGQHDNCGGVPTIVPSSVYEDGLLALRETYAGKAGTYLIGPDRWYLDFGLGHTALRSPTFWTTVVDDVSVEEWVGHVIDGDPLSVGP
ncbi:MAG: pectin acetylesterase-family hydrolase [Polyangiaceae bacterium]